MLEKNRKDNRQRKCQKKKQKMLDRERIDRENARYRKSIDTDN